ncbi:MAG: carbon starvation protein A [Paramuribaculum sp.]|nr:carbon starvation protein A [Paramuribaculum sp.]
MTAFLIALAVLVGGYFLYGLFIDRILETSASNPTPAYTKRDDIDFHPMPVWKVFLIQFLNIAGLGPIFGAIMGIMFGPAAFLWIALGTIFGGAVHDFASGVISLRQGGASLPEIVGGQLGNGVRRTMVIFSVLLLILVTAVFVSTPAGLLASMTPDYLDRKFWLIAIFAYYVLATLLPIDKLIGKIYPLFGFALLFMALGLLGVLIFTSVEIPVSFSEMMRPSTAPAAIFPMMFVSIACGAISGFHATQSPMMARCLTNEKLARPVFYGAMVAEGIVALIWAAAAVTYTGGYEQLSTYMTMDGHDAGSLVKDVSFSWLGTFGGILAILGVIAAPITTGDTALRSARLTVADFLHISQSKITRRILVTIPLIIVVALLMMMDFSVLWRYFAWSNQTLSVFTLWAVTVYLARHAKPWIITMLPAMFMTIVCVSYILCAPRPEGFGVDITAATLIGLTVAIIFAAIFLKYKNRLTVHQTANDD